MQDKRSTPKKTCVFVDFDFSAMYPIAKIAKQTFHPSIIRNYGACVKAASIYTTFLRGGVFKQLVITFDNPNQPPSTTTENCQDNYRYSLSASPMHPTIIGHSGQVLPMTHQLWRAHGTVPPRIPDNNRTWVAFGLGYRFSTLLNLDAGYAHIFVSDAQINQTATGENALRGGLKGTYDSHIDIVSAQVNLQF